MPYRIDHHPQMPPTRGEHAAADALNQLMHPRRLTLADRAVLAALGLYRRHLTRYSKPCTQDPSCSEYALGRVSEVGWRTGLADTRERMIFCRCDRPGE